MSELDLEKCPGARARSLAGGVVAALLLALCMAWLWGFTVDDALITARVAHHLARGLGHRFNPGGPEVDAVTPFGFAYLLAPFAAAGPLAAWHAAKVLGGLSMLPAAFALGRRVMERSSSASYGSALIVTLATSVPLSAWAVAGMETGLVTALCVAALGRGVVSDACAALAAAWRPELGPWCVAVRLGLALAHGASGRRAALSAAAPMLAVLVVALLRAWLFGRPAPLSVLAKPSDWEHGLRYALFGFVQTGLPLMLLSPFGLRRGAPVARALTVAAAVHFAALVAAGGDWMSLYRLVVPVLPSCVLAAAELSRVVRPWASWSRLALALAMSCYVGLSLQGAARRVSGDREQLIAQARPLLEGAVAVAALDVGWVGAATGTTIVDLAGVTDERVAVLPGGHTSKRIDDALLRGRHVDAVVLLRYPALAQGYAREVERRLMTLPAARELTLVKTLPAGPPTQVYDVLRRP
jgi:hypothetical protein